MKSTTKHEAAQGGPTVRDLLDARRLTPAQVAEKATIGLSTIYRALGGHRVSTLVVFALSGALGVEPPEIRKAIERSRPASAKGAA